MCWIYFIDVFDRFGWEIAVVITRTHIDHLVTTRIRGFNLWFGKMCWWQRH